MKIIAFKRAKNVPSLHPEFITEFIDADLLESTEGYETMIQEHFDLEYAKNPERHETHTKHMKEEFQKKQSAQQAVDIQELKEIKEMEREFERFKAWKRHNGKK